MTLCFWQQRNTTTPIYSHSAASHYFEISRQTFQTHIRRKFERVVETFNILSGNARIHMASNQALISKSAPLATKVLLFFLSTAVHVPNRDV
jgi:hypothetical protein